MAQKTTIEWTDRTWNPVTGCTKVSPGCANCYAERITERFKGKGSFERVVLASDHLEDPLHWRKPQRIFVNSMSDLFHEDIPVEFIDKVFAVMAMCPQHTFQILTKRPERMREYLRQIQDDEKDMHRWEGAATEIMGSPLLVQISEMDWPLKNVWLGVSVENQHFADERIPILLGTPAAIRFISAEPLLGPVDLRHLVHGPDVPVRPKPGTWGMTGTGPLPTEKKSSGSQVDALTGQWKDATGELVGTLPYPLDWVIVGGESGPGARPMHPDWARSLRDQCNAANVPFLFKQWGEWSHITYFDAKGPMLKISVPAHVENKSTREIVMGNVNMVRWGKKKSGRLLDGREWNEFPCG